MIPDKTTFVELNKRKEKKIILFGSGNIAKKTIRRIEGDRIDFIVDSSENLQGTTYEGLNIKSPKEVAKDHLVIICSTAITDISKLLNGKSLIPNTDYTLSPILNDLLAISELEQLETSFYFTSGTVPMEGRPWGGGLYKCTLQGPDVSLDRLYSGPCYGATKVDSKIYFVDTDKGLHSFDGTHFEHKCFLPDGSRAHGVSYNEDNQHFYITCSYLDAVIEISSDFEIKRTLKLSNKINSSGQPMHHCNDNLAIGNSLFVSMFSSTGNWKIDCFDGCIAEFDLETGERLRDIFTDLYMPHNVKLHDGSLHILDSLPGHLRFNNFSIQGTFPAFTRGLDYSNGHYYIGQSKNRNYSKVMGLSNNISIDCGVVVFNPEIKASRFIQFPHAIGEIHSIVCL